MLYNGINKKFTLILMACAVLLYSCNDDETDEMMDDDETPTGMLTVSDQTISQNKIMVSNIDLDQNGWVVVHASTGDGGPVVPDIISEPLLVSAGGESDLEITLTEETQLEDGDVVWVMLHTDDGVAGTYEFDGNNGFDAPITDEDGEIVMTSITISAPSITAEAQVISENMISIGEVKAAVDGWLVIHADNEGAPGEVLGQTMVSAGSNTDVIVDLGSAVFAGGETLWPMLHIESPADGEYGFPDNGDGPEVFGEDVVVVSIETIAPSGTISVTDQVLQGNMLSVGEVTMDAAGWVVVHASNANNDGPQVPEIISTPVQLDAGTSSDVAIELTEAVDADAILYVMLHTDNGVIGEYEFDGENGFDGPVIVDSDIVLEAVTILPTTGEFTANNQVVSQNKLVVESVTVGQPSWLVVHRDDGTGTTFVAPAIMSEPVAIDAGTTENVEISLADGESLEDGERLWLMIHNDNGVVGSYEFGDVNGVDLPIIFSSIDIEAPFVTASDQAVAGSTVVVDEVKAAVDGWIVIHANNDGAPGDVLGQAFVEAGTSMDVSVDLGETTPSTGDIFFPMLHIESPADGEYGFPDNGDDPEIFGLNEDGSAHVVVTSFTTL
ncbi:MAG: hypothetical protein RIC35_16165 [Marinoscillum sp.]